MSEQCFRGIAKGRLVGRCKRQSIGYLYTTFFGEYRPVCKQHRDAILDNPASTLLKPKFLTNGEYGRRNDVS